VVLLVRNLELGIRRLAKIGEFLALVSLSQVGDSDRAIFLLAEVTLNQWVALRRTVILLDMKIAAVFVILHPTLVRSLSFIDNTAMADFEDQNCQPVILNATQNAVVPDSVSPKSGELVEQRLPEVSWVGCNCDSVVQICKDATLDGLV